MAREVVPLRLAEDEKAAIARAAAGLKITVSEFLRRAGLASAFRLSVGEQPAKPRPVVVEADAGEIALAQKRARVSLQTDPVPVVDPEPQSTEPHYSATYTSFEQYQSSSPFVSGGPVFPAGGTMRNV